jgi:hypothetical protein
MTGAAPIRGRRLIVVLMVATVLGLPAAHIAALLGTSGGAPARDLLLLVFYVAIALTLAANVAVAFSLSLTVALANADPPVGEGLTSRLRRLALRDSLPPQLLIGIMLAPMIVLLLGFGAWVLTTHYRAGNLLFLALIALDLAALSAALLALLLLASILFFRRARRSAEMEDASGR